MASDAQTVERAAKPAPPRAAAPDKPVSLKSAGGRQVTLQDRYVIFPDRPYPELTTAQTPAVGAADPLTPGAVRAALICHVDPLPRIDVMDKVKGLARPGLAPLAAFGAVDWPGPHAPRPPLVLTP